MEKRIVAVCLALLLLCLPVCGSSFAAELDSQTVKNKIDPDLLQRLNSMEKWEQIDVSVWLIEPDKSEIVKEARSRLKMRIEQGSVGERALLYADMQQNDVNPLKMYAADQKQDIVQLESRTKHELTSAEAQAVVETEREAASGFYTEQNRQVFDRLFPKTQVGLFRSIPKEQPEVLYSCKYAPNVMMTLTKSEIMTIINSDEVESIYYAPPAEEALAEPEIPLIEEQSAVEESTIPVVWQKITGIEYMRDTLHKDGSGIKIGQVEAGVLDDSKPSFQYAKDNNKIHILNGSRTDHPTYVASIMIGKTQNYTGIVPEAELYASSNQGQTYKEAIESLLHEGVNVINASAYFDYKYIGIVSDEYPDKFDHYFNQYRDITKWIDHISLDHHVAIVISSGNLNPAGVACGGMAYNAISVGNLNDHKTESLTDDTLASTSSYCADESKPYKPDLIAPGSCVTTSAAPEMTNGGTSAAAPVVTGAIAQLLQAQPYLKTNPELVKALLLCGTTHMSAVSSSVSTVPAMTRQSGAGMLNVYNSFTALSLSSYPKYATGSLEYSEFGPITKSLLVTKSNVPLNIALTWTKTTSFNSISDHDKIDNLGAAALSFLKLEVKAPDGTTYTSFNVTGNVQRVSIPAVSVKAGTYHITVSRNGPSGHTTYYAITALNGDVMS